MVLQGNRDVVCERYIVLHALVLLGLCCVVLVFTGVVECRAAVSLIGCGVVLPGC